MRTGAEYREALRDGRKVWVIGAGAVDDVTRHPATSAMEAKERMDFVIIDFMLVIDSDKTTV